MRCVKPIVVGKNHYTVPCGRCIACRINKTEEWATRIMHECSGKDCCFVTLTYNDDNLPENSTLVKKHVQDFMKLFRRRIEPLKVRYFLSGEYGDLGNRPHYHIIVIGYDFPDKVFLKMHNGHPLYISKFLENVWQKGFCTVEDVNYKSARYCAKYTIKRLTGERAKEYENKKIIPEFSLMSRRNGIGYDVALLNSSVYAENGFCVVDGRKKPVPRYYKVKFFTKDVLDNKKREQGLKNIERVLTFQNKYGKNYYEDERERLAQAERSIISKTKMRKKERD